MENIKELREKKGLTRDQLAALMEVSAVTIYHWEQGNGMHLKYQKKLQRILGEK